MTPSSRSVSFVRSYGLGTQPLIASVRPTMSMGGIQPLTLSWTSAAWGVPSSPLGDLDDAAFGSREEPPPFIPDRRIALAAGDLKRFSVHARARLRGWLALAGRAYLRKLEQQRLELRRQLDERSALLERATRDPLTKLWNRQAILDIVERELALVERAATALAVVMIDIDHFKRINDTHGHLAGDGVLREIGSRLSSALRRTDYLGRYGGEELIVVMPGLPLDAGFIQVERLRLSLAESPVAFDGRAILVTASFGVAWTNNATHSASLLIGHADTALYEAKRGGRNRTMLYLADATAVDEASPVRNE